MCADDNDLTTPWQNSAWLIRFLRARKYNVKKTYELVRSIIL